MNEANPPPEFDRISLRAVLVRDGEDVKAALAQAGLVDVVSVPVIVGDYAGPPTGILGDGITPNLTAVLETESDDPFAAAFNSWPNSARKQTRATRPPEPAPVNLPEAFGIRPLAPAGGTAGRSGKSSPETPPVPSGIVTTTGGE